ncbi:MAG: M24 family metallopeptidase [Bacteroidales bacterium]|nr:M24 family metallopeptidase [Bacteroidales bacterium]
MRFSAMDPAYFSENKERLMGKMKPDLATILSSHILGLDVHDLGTKDIVLEPGMISTCEPGKYIAEEQVSIRIENDILITETENLDLMEEISVEPYEIEHQMNRFR